MVYSIPVILSERNSGNKTEGTWGAIRETAKEYCDPDKTAGGGKTGSQKYISHLLTDGRGGGNVKGNHGVVQITTTDCPLV